MKNINRIRSPDHCGAYSLVEVMVAMAIVGVLFMATLGAMQFNKIQIYKDKERGLVLDFVVHYLELVKGQNFADIQKGAPINSLYDGTMGAGDIRIPMNSSWFSLKNNTNYQTFYSELAWLYPRDPEMRVDLATTQAGGVDHTKHVRVEVRWDSPLNLGRRCTARMDMVRTKDL